MQHADKEAEKRQHAEAEKIQHADEAAGCCCGPIQRNCGCEYAAVMSDHSV